uniref:Uncharacterized protein n=1 Tax=Thermodesulfobacterium geofontis TaxID=1295609 RepID=A0A7C4NTL3_9BACT
MKKLLFAIFIFSSLYVFLFTFLASSQPPIKPVEPAPRPRPDFQPSQPPSGFQPPAYYPPCEGWIEVIQPVIIKYPGRFGEETITTLNQYERKIIQIPENLIPAELKVTYRLKNKTNYYLRLDNLWIRYGNRGWAHPPVNFTPFEQKNIEQKIILNEGSGGQYLYFGIGGPRGCQEDTLMIFFNAFLMVHIIVL